MIPTARMLAAGFAALALVAPTWSAPAPAAASCAAPDLRLEGGRWSDGGRPVVVAGAELVVEGRRFASCDDTGQVEVGLLGCSRQAPLDPPVAGTDLELVLVQGGRTWSLGRADAVDQGSDLGAVRWSVRTPAAARPGPARLQVEASEPLPVRVAR